MRRKCDFGIFRADRMRMKAREGQLEIHFKLSLSAVVKSLKDQQTP